jgi:hypothetical protein
MGKKSIEFSWGFFLATFPKAAPAINNNHGGDIVRGTVNED